MAGAVPLAPPRTAFVYEAIVDIGETRSLGPSPLGERRLVPIIGGAFWGPRLRGIVLPGGADRQLVRADGCVQLRALYDMQTHDGAVLTVLNRVLIDETAGGLPAHLLVHITAPEGAYAWLNRKVLVGTLDTLAPTRQAALVRVFELV